MTFASFQNDTRQRLEQHLNQLLQQPVASRLVEAMRYSLLDGGKRLRPTLVRAAAESLSAEPDTWLYPAAALEMMHVYSLIHDDLPAMDDDDLRRGKATNHRAFDEATAILAGDALQSLAFEHLSQTPGLDANTRLAMVGILARQAGHAGMVGGQMLDLQAEGQQLGLDDLARIHRLKTGALIESALHLGALCTNAPLPDVTRAALTTFGQALGLAFQITDDMLDVTADTATLGKPQGSDAALNKSTYVQLLGLDGARREAQQHTDAALAALDQLGIDPASPLRALTNYVLNRNH
ncbi:polyprenyl synthetase family protein [Saccharospirillum alexandrii]|uniref:polyprenyl synthetase family protein n=1 Tax=Saccharospirillum alexandrii TaxID=2448477 RepID=UPI001742E1B4